MGLYITVEQFRDRTKFTEDDAIDQDIHDALVLAQQILERATRQWFEPRGPYTFSVDGTDSDALHFAVPIISIDELKINNSETATPLESYRVYNGRGRPIDDRKNPRIKLRSPFNDPGIFEAPLIGSGHIFRKGRQNQVITGTFGYVDEDDEGKLVTPPAIIRALVKLTAEKLGQPIGKKTGTVSLPSTIGGIVAEEWTDGHKKKYSVPALGGRRPGLSGVSLDASATAGSGACASRRCRTRARIAISST